MDKGPDRAFVVGLARAFGGALIFTLPVLMTMEMWWIGSYIDPWRMALLLVVNVPLLVGLSHFMGFERTFALKDDLVDAFVAYGVGFVAAALILWLFGVLHAGVSVHEVVGKLAIQAVPGSIGALLAQSQFGGGNDDDHRRRRTGLRRYASQIFLMTVGAVYLSLNVAPTEEMVLISYKMTPAHALLMAGASLALMHAFVYSLKFRGGSDVPRGRQGWQVFLRFAVVGYAVCLLISGYMLWTFGRTDAAAAMEVVMAAVVLSFPAAVGAAAARLIL